MSTFDSGAFEITAFETTTGGGGTGINGSLAKTLGAATTSGAGAVQIQASLSKTLGATTCTAQGGAAAAGSLAKTLGSATLASAGTLAASGINGSLSATLASMGVVSAAGVTVNGTLVQTLGALTSALPQPAPNEHSATIMRESKINSSVIALLDRIASQAGTISDAMSNSTIMQAAPVNTSGAMSADAINQTAEIL